METETEQEQPVVKEKGRKTIMDLLEDFKPMEVIQMEFKCNKCDKTAEYIVDGQSVCAEHKDDAKQDGQDDMTPGERMAGRD